MIFFANKKAAKFFRRLLPAFSVAGFMQRETTTDPLFRCTYFPA